MKIQQVTSLWDNDFSAIMECEHCGAKENLTTGYNDHYYHNNVIPSFHCKSCGKDRAGNVTEAPNKRDVIWTYCIPGRQPPAEGSYQCKCVHCGELFNGHKREVTCPKCKRPPAESETPETDAWLRGYYGYAWRGYSNPQVDAEFARRLERERNALRAKNDKLFERLHDLVSDLSDACEERNALRRDAGRYRWLRDSGKIRCLDDSRYYYEGHSTKHCDAAIDAAIAQEQGK